jgi:hypothetical protein
MAQCRSSKDFALGTKTALKAIAALVLVIAMSSPAFSQITVTTPKAASTVTEKAITITGTATAAPSVYEEKDSAALDAGSKMNFTLTGTPALVLSPYIGVWNKGQNNPVVSNGAAGSYHEVGTYAGSAILDGATYKMWGMGINAGGFPYFGLWTSADGKAWAESSGISIFNRSVTTTAFDYSAIAAPWVIKDGATYKMWYSGKASDGRWRIGYATSSDGLTWTRQNSGNPVFDRGLVARFDGGGVAYPSVIKDGNTYRMWYAGVIESTSIWQIGYATSANGISWTRQNNSNPVLGFGKKGTYDESGLLYPRVVKDGPTFRLWYIGMNMKAVCYASSKDGISWARDQNNPVMSPSATPGDFDGTQILEFAVMRDGLKFKMWYTGDNAGTRTIGYAEADVEGMTGIYTSKPFDAQNTVTWGKIAWNWDTPIGTSGTMETRTSEDNSKWTTWDLATNNSAVLSSPNRYFQYKVTIATTDSNIVGSFFSMSVDYTQVVRVEVSLDNSSWFIANGTETWDIQMTLTEGNNTIYVKVTDTTPYPQYLNFYVTVDTTLPTGHLSINKGAIFTTKLNVYLDLSAQDLNGVQKMRIGNSDDLLNVTWENFVANKSWTLTPNDGVKTVYAEFQDVNGLASRTYSDTIILDTTAPQGSLLINDNSTFAAITEVHVTLKATDKNGISKMRVSTNESFQGADWGPFTSTLSLTLPSGDGEKWVYAQFIDSAGLTKTVKDSIFLDTVKPTGSITINNGTTLTRERKIYLTLEATDSSGVKDMMVSAFPDFVDGIWEPMAAHKNWTLPNSLGDNYLYARYRDFAGLTSERSQAHIFLYTRTLAGSIIINNGDKLTGNPEVTLTINLLDNDGETKMMVSNDDRFSGGLWQNYNKTQTWTLSGTTNAEYFVYLKFKDKFNIESATYSSSISLDTMAPVVTLTYPTNSLVWTSKNGTIDITGTAMDETGLSRLQVQVDGGPWIQMQEFGHFKLRQYITVRGSHTVKARAIDYVGNQANTTVTFTWPAEKKKENKAFIPGFESLALIAVVALVPLLRRKKI